MNIHSVAKKLGMDTLAETVGELIALLSKLPPDTRLYINGPDLGGYDVVACDYVYVDARDGAVRLGHLDYKAYAAHENEEITRAEYEQLRGGYLPNG